MDEEVSAITSGTDKSKRKWFSLSVIFSSD